MSEIPANSDADRWRMRQPDGTCYGPVAKVELDRWFAEGRIGPQCQISSPAESVWQYAAEYYPSLAAPPAPTRPSPLGSLAAAKPVGSGSSLNPLIIVVGAIDLIMGLFHLVYSLLLIFRSVAFVLFLAFADIPQSSETEILQGLTVLCIVSGIVGMAAGVFTLFCAYATAMKRPWARMAHINLAAYFVGAALFHAYANGRFHPITASLLFFMAIGYAILTTIFMSLPQVAKDFAGSPGNAAS